MKKTIVSLVVAFLSVPLIAFGYTTLFNFYQGHLPSIQERAKIYMEINSDKYTGTYEQNNRLLKYLQGTYPVSDYLVVLIDPFSNQEVENPYTTFGADSGQRPSNFKTTLSRSLTATASTTETIYVSSLTTKDSHTLTSADIGDFIAFHINPGASNDEIVVCTAVGTSSFTNCTRGYGFYTNAAVSGNAKSHSPGETVVISNDDTWLKTQYTANDDDETIYGTWSFASSTATSRIQIGGGNSTYDKIIYSYNGDVSKPFLMYDESENTWVYSNDGTNSTAIGGGASTYTAGDGLSLTSSDFDIDLATLSGLAITGGKLAVASSSDIIILGDGKAYVATTTPKTISGAWTFTGGVSGVANTGGDGSDGSVTITTGTTLTRDMYYQNLTINTGITLNPAGYRIYATGTVDISGTIARNGNAGGVGGSASPCATPGTGGAELASGYLFGSFAGSAGGIYNTDGTNGTSTVGLGSNGANGGRGQGNGSYGASGTGGTTASSTKLTVGWRVEQMLNTIFTTTASSTTFEKYGNCGSAAGGGGGESVSGNTGCGGGGGSAGGIIVIYAKTILLNASSSIEVKGGTGGNGGNGAGTSGAGGGGGGGNGGQIILVYQSLTNNGSILVTGGTGGAVGTGGAGASPVAGSDGSVGNIRYFSNYSF